MLLFMNGDAYTEYTHNLVYQAQSKALNEAYSNIIAESIQIMNNTSVAFNTRNPNFSCITFTRTTSSQKR